MIWGNSLILQTMKLAQKEAFAYPRSQSKSAAELIPEAKTSCLASCPGAVPVTPCCRPRVA